MATEIEQMDEESQLVADQVKKLKTKVKYSETLLTKVTTKLWGDVESSAIMGKLLDGDNKAGLVQMDTVRDCFLKHFKETSSGFEC